MPALDERLGSMEGTREDLCGQPPVEDPQSTVEGVTPQRSAVVPKPPFLPVARPESWIVCWAGPPSTSHGDATVLSSQCRSGVRSAF